MKRFKTEAAPYILLKHSKYLDVNFKALVCQTFKIYLQIKGYCPSLSTYKQITKQLPKQTDQRRKKGWNR